MVAWLGLAFGGALGAVCRYLVSTTVSRLLPLRFPLGTLTVNISGALMIGVLAGMLGAGLIRPAVDEWLWLSLGVGFCGSYTTMSSWSLDTLKLGLEGYPWRMLANFALTFSGCLLAVMGGYWGGTFLVA
ncbi:fluoride efflux transporter FluC [Natronospira bacteriovora]|uniref:Fluoride-specific ion channel FluC n=1 Tax=Natronospira bacteriovora TaxID=3069753 RepID=A0ABU0W378_9GAMM|nr:CrcB family protein [Natronospira sp. AB-CW4]MDQ2068378.1 CrcB family protein [Natronospira sp. AB-CW4]